MSGIGVLCKSSSSPFSLFPPSSFIPTSHSIKTFKTFTNNFNLLSSKLIFSTSSPRPRTMATEPSASNNNGVPEESSSSSSAPSASSAIDFLTLCHRLKATKRTGWIKRDIKGPESIADHMYRMGVMALITADIPGVNRDKCIKMAIVHDIAEAIVGDITPCDGVPKEEKNRREREALDQMCNLLGGGERAKEINDLWMEYENNSTPEAKVVKDLDKVEMILQALEYETEQGRDLEEFFESTAGKFQTDLGKSWASEIASRRKKKEEK
ncbi:hypothetical protein MKW94_013370 [Papaver nudicaule]|uniref:5'-deoxynucleotidase n=1 Tax=Papaver nudicaule TaxID=74823 RepID=A0AA41RWL2_PAPNU|nr:hypothetical protein [Papaver nudicaule]